MEACLLSFSGLMFYQRSSPDDLGTQRTKLAQRAFRLEYQLLKPSLIDLCAYSVSKVSLWYMVNSLLCFKFFYKCGNARKIFRFQ